MSAWRVCLGIGMFAGMALLAGCGPDSRKGREAFDGGPDLSVPDAGPMADGNVSVDLGGADAGNVDGGGADAGGVDAGPADAGPPADPCTAPGSTETVSCGNCGTTERFCTADRVWVYGACSGEGECAPGTTEARPCGRCGTAEARCSVSCTWSVSATCTGEGMCTPGDTMRTDAGCGMGQSRALVCGDACTFVPGPCEIDECVPGAFETVSCGNCGTRERTCDATRRWVNGPCVGEGECAPGTTAMGACGRCGTQRTVCDTTCRFVPMGTCGGESGCLPGSVTPCTTTCGSAGTSTCTDTCGTGACVPPSESCDGVDNDCDGSVDEGCSGCFGCAGSTTVTGSGGRYAVALEPNRFTGTCGGAGSEALLTVTLTATSDVFVATHGAGIDTVLHARGCSCTGTQIGCNDDADGLTSSVLRLNALAAGTYTIIVDTKAALSASVPVDVYVTPTGTEGDRCGRPRALAAGTTRITGDTCLFANDLDTTTLASGCSVPGSGAGTDLVYYFYVPTTRTLTFDGCNESFTYDGTIYVRSACNDNSVTTEIVCDDDGCAAGTGTCTSLGYGPRASATFAPGLYYLVVDGYTAGGASTCASCGAFDVSISGL